MDERQRTGKDSRGFFQVKGYRMEIFWSTLLGIIAATLLVIVLS